MDVDATFIADLKRVTTTFSGPSNHQLRMVYQRARKYNPYTSIPLLIFLGALLSKKPSEYSLRIPERFSDALLRSVLEFVGVNDFELSPFEMR